MSAEDDARLVADALRRASGFARHSILGELPVADAAAFLREEVRRALVGGAVTPADAHELDVMVRFYRLCLIRPSLHALHYPEAVSDAG